MELIRVRIRNFRSIEDLEIDLSPRCRTLVGINESGKTNILHALSLLSPDRSFSIEDVREQLRDEPPVEHAYVQFIFSFDKNENNLIFEKVKKES